MPVAYFQVQLSLQPQGGSAELIPPKVLNDLHYSFVIVKEGGEKGIIRLDEPDEVLKQVEEDRQCSRLTPQEMETLRESYPPPKLKQKYRTQSQTQRTAIGGPFEVNEQGSKIIDTFQTVRSGFYLIDVLVITPSASG